MKWCCNPYNYSKHSIRKQLYVREISPQAMDSYRKIFPRFPWILGQTLCMNCRLSIDKEVKLFQPILNGVRLAKQATKRRTTGFYENPHFPQSNNVATKESVVHLSDLEEDWELPSNRQSNCSSPSASNISASSVCSDFEATRAVAQVDLNKSLNAFNVTPIVPSDSKKKYLLKRKLVKIGTTVSKQVAAFADRTVKITPLAVKSSCRYCAELLDDLSIKFKTLTTTADKYKILTSVPKRFKIRDIQTKFQCSLYQSRKASRLRNTQGAFSWTVHHYERQLSSETTEAVKKFYLAPENSRPSPNESETVYITDENGKRVQAAKHRLLLNLNDLYASFLAHFPRLQVSVSKFSTLRPKNCVWPGKQGYHITCVCEIHENFKFMIQALNLEVGLEEILNGIVCPNPTEECYLGLCPGCPNVKFIDSMFAGLEDEDEIEYLNWKHTDCTEINKITTSLETFRQDFENYISKILAHDYVYRRQRDFLKTLKEKYLREELAITIQVDFAQNYSFIVQNAVQGFHWTNRQATIHPFVVHWWDSETDDVVYRTYCLISNEMSHDADSFHTFKTLALDQILKDLRKLNCQMIYYISDGAGGQYKNYKNFANLMKHEEDFQVKAEWHFEATSHGKSTCDAISAVVKSSTRLESLKPGAYITTAESMFDFCVRKLTSTTLKFLFADKQLVAKDRDLLSVRYNSFKPIPGSRQYHMFKPNRGSMIMKHFSTSSKSSTFNFARGEATEFEICDLNIGDFYCFVAADKYQVGMLVEINDKYLDVTFQVMKINRSNGILNWPLSPSFLEVAIRDIFLHVSDPESEDSTNYKIIKEDLIRIREAYKSFSRKQSGNATFDK